MDKVDNNGNKITGDELPLIHMETPNQEKLIEANEGYVTFTK